MLRHEPAMNLSAALAGCNCVVVVRKVLVRAVAVAL